MQRARVIEMKERSYFEDDSFLKDRYCLRINGILICNFANKEWTNFPKHFQTSLCNYCGEEGCSTGGMLAIRRDEKKILFIPKFDWMETWEEYHLDEEGYGAGDSECPPHEWYERGILVLEYLMVYELMKLFPKILFSEIPEISKAEADLVNKWERMVKEQPETGFKWTEKPHAPDDKTNKPKGRSK